MQTFLLDQPKWFTLRWGTVLAFVFFLFGTGATAQTVQVTEVLSRGFMMDSSFYRVYHVDEYVVYQSQVHFTNSVVKLKVDSAGNESSTEDSVTSSGWKSRYFVRHRDSSYGYRFDLDKLYLTPRLAVGAELANIAGTNTFEKLLGKKPDSLVATADSSERTEIFLSPASADTPAVRLVFSYSRKLNRLRHSLNTVLDSAKQMKLWKVEFKIASFYHKKSKTTFPEAYLSTEMRELPPEVPEEVLFYLNWYKDVFR